MAVNQTRTLVPAPLLGIEDAAALMAAIVASSTDAILSKTLNGIVTSWNTAAERLTGYTAAEIIGQAVSVMIPENLWHEEEEILSRIAAGERIENYETIRLTKDGRPVEVSVTISPIRESGGSIIGASSIIRDISARKNAERSAAFLAAIIASTSDGVVSKTLDGTITSWNKAAERMFGFAAEEMVNQSIRRIIPKDRQTEEDGILAAVVAGNLIDSFETVRLRKDGMLIEVSITVSPIRDALGKVIGASKIARDITDRRQAEKQLRLLLGEVNHRSKNLLSLVQAIARQMTRRGGPLDLDRFLERLQAIARNQDLLIQNDWRSIALDQLVRSQLGTFSDLMDSRITVEGPKIELTPESAQTIGIALHELSTNAAKYGALSNGTGRVSIRWSVDGEEFFLSWIESGGRPIKAPTRKGFGFRVLSTMVELSLDGNVELSYPESGLNWRLKCPIDRISGDRAACVAIS